MHAKSKKGAKSPLHKKSTKAPRSWAYWPNLPTQLLTIIAKNSILGQRAMLLDAKISINYDSSVTKLYRLPPRKCNPTGRSPFPQLSINDSRSPKVSPYDPDIGVPFKHVAFSTSPIDPHNGIRTKMAVTGIQKPALAFYDKVAAGRDPFTYAWKQETYAWFKQDSTLVDPHSSSHQLMQFTNAIGFKGKFYALSLQGTLAVIEKIDSHFRITSLGTNRAVPTVPSRHFKEYLIESNGEMLLVFLTSRKSNIHRVENVEVHRLQLDRLSWVKMESIGNRTLFVGTNYCMSINASKVGCSENCIYLSCEIADDWWVYDMESESISPGRENCFLLQNPPMCMG